MKIISLLISCFGIIQTKALECVSVINRKCMPRPKILDVNEGVGEALFYPYNVLVNKCSGRHESCKCVCKLNSSVCNNKQIWNIDTCKCDCNEDFAIIINCTKGYTWNPSTCECQCDTCFKPGQYLDHKNCICKNKLIGIVIEEGTSVINETMINNKENMTNDNTYLILFILFLVLFIVFLIGFICYY